MYWVLASDEALIVEFDAHDGLWMLTNMGVFFNRLDYLYRPVSYTPSRATTDGDGKVRLVLAHDDPGSTIGSIPTGLSAVTSPTVTCSTVSRQR
jgi:hypothetical protein